MNNFNKYKKYYLSYIIQTIYIIILLILNYFIKNLNLSYCLFSILNLNFLTNSFIEYKKTKDNLNLIETIGCIISLCGLIILIIIK